MYPWLPTVHTSPMQFFLLTTFRFMWWHVGGRKDVPRVLEQGYWKAQWSKLQWCGHGRKEMSIVYMRHTILVPFHNLVRVNSRLHTHLSNWQSQGIVVSGLCSVRSCNGSSRACFTIQWCSSRTQQELSVRVVKVCTIDMMKEHNCAPSDSPDLEVLRSPHVTEQFTWRAATTTSVR